jgi:MFS family permease
MNKRVLAMIFVVLAGEAIFMLPFMVPRLYRPLMLEAWGITNTDFGVAFAAYGILAMLSYLFGGPFADKYHPRILIGASLLLTAIGSLYLVCFPSATSLIITYGFFGVSTIFLMWSALIKTTHIAGGESQRSLAMGILDGGRGLAAAAFSSFLVLVVYIGTPELTTRDNQIHALTMIYATTILLSLLIAAGIWITLKDLDDGNKAHSPWEFVKIIQGLKDIRVWLLSLVVLGSYCGYKGIDNYSTYLVDVYKMDLSTASRFTSVIFWLRPISAFVAGYLADYFHKNSHAGRFLVLLVLLLVGAISQLLLAFAGEVNFLYAFSVIVLTAAFTYGLRGIYFSVFGDLKVPQHLVGTTTGIVSFIGFMPDVFFGLVTGRMIDANPGLPGFQQAFLFTAAALFIGALASFLLYRKIR